MRLVDRMGRRFGLRDLNILLAVVECGSMARAARDLAVSQPVISKTIADLEEELGVRLLDRSRRGIAPTPYGRALLKRSVAAFDELRQGVKEIEFLAEPTAGEVRIGALAAMVAGLLPAVIAQMRLRYPHLAIHVMQMLTSPRLYDSLYDRDVDFVIGRVLNRPLQPDLNAESLFDEPLFVVSGIDSPFTTRRKLAIADLIDEPWVLPQPQTEVGALVADVFHASSSQVPRNAVVCSSIEISMSLLSTGRFLAVLPLSILRFSLQRGAIKTLPIKVPVQVRPVGIVTLRDRTLSPAAELFINNIRETAKRLEFSRT